MSKKNNKFLDENQIISNIKNMSLSICQEYKSMLCLTDVLYTLYHDYLSYDIERPNWVNRDRIVVTDKHLYPLVYTLNFFFTNNFDINVLKQYLFANRMDAINDIYNEKNNIDSLVYYGDSMLGLSIGFALGNQILAEKFNRKNINLFNYYTYLICSSSTLEDNGLSLASDYNLTGYVVICLNDEGKERGEKLIDMYLALDFEVIYIKNLQNEKEIHKAFDSISKIKKPVFILGDIFESSREEESIIDEENIKLFREEIKNNISGSYSAWYDYYKKYMTLEIDQKKEELVNFLNNEQLSLKLDKIIDTSKIDINMSLQQLNLSYLNVINNYTTSFIFSSLYKDYLPSVNKDSVNTISPYNILFSKKNTIVSDVLNGLALLGFRVLITTKLIDAPKMISGIRHSAMMNLPVTYIFTSDTFMSQNLGDSSPINELGMLRGISNLEVYRPADYKELMGSWNSIFEENKPAAIVLSNQKPNTYKYTLASEVSLGGYVISEVKTKLDLIILSSGSDLKIAYKLKEELLKNYIESRVVSVPCLRKFINSDDDYIKQTLPKGYKRVVIELSNDSMWQNILNSNDEFFGLDGYAKYGNNEELLKAYGLDMTSMIIKIKESL